MDAEATLSSRASTCSRIYLSTLRPTSGGISHRNSRNNLLSFFFILRVVPFHVQFLIFLIHEINFFGGNFFA